MTTTVVPTLTTTQLYATPEKRPWDETLSTPTTTSTKTHKSHSHASKFPTNVYPQSLSSPSRSSATQSQTQRIEDLLRALPVLAVALLAALLYFVFILLHCMPLLQLKIPYEIRDDAARIRGIVQCAVFHFLFIMFVISYILTVITPAGSIPFTPEWRSVSSAKSIWDIPAASAGLLKSISHNSHNEEFSPLLPSLSSPKECNSPKECDTPTQHQHQRHNAKAVQIPIPRLPPVPNELKRSGDRRHCKWCKAVKPDRAHHCRVCRSCVLRMDHHCPWVYNCIGYGNHKYFLLLLFYGSAVLTFAVICQLESLVSAIDEPLVTNGNLFLLLFSEALEVLLSVLCSVFFLFHLWLVRNEMSTIEFCEKKFRREFTVDVYDRGCCLNMHTAFGNNPLLWFLPIDDRAGNGLTFEVPAKRDGDKQLEKGNGDHWASKPIASSSSTSSSDDLESQTGMMSLGRRGRASRNSQVEGSVTSFKTAKNKETN